MPLPEGIDWVTGASSGIGRALALELATRGRRVAVSARRAEALAALAQEAETLPGQVIPLPLDITDQKAVSETLAKIERDLGPLAVAVLNAGVHIPTKAKALAPEDFRSLVELNLMGTLYCLAAAVEPMRARRRGQIAVVGSVAGYFGLPTAAGYGMTKAGLINMTQALQPELAAMGIKLQLVNPGFVKTPLTDRNRFPMPFLMPVDKAAARLLKGLESERFEIVFPWRLAALLRLLRALPMGWALSITRRMARR